MQFPAAKFKAAGLNTTDVAVLFKVTRTTASNWLRGRKVHVMLRETVQHMENLLDIAVDSGALPWSPASRVPSAPWSAVARAHHIRSLVLEPRG